MAEPITSEDIVANGPVHVDIVLGHVHMPLKAFLTLSAGDILELDRTIEDPVDLYVSDRLIARGKLVMIDDEVSLIIDEAIDMFGAA